MKQSVLDRSIARATGESVRRIRQMGFSLLIVPPVDLPQQPRCCPAVNRARTTTHAAPVGRCA
jgi:hypothetical protein